MRQEGSIVPGVGLTAGRGERTPDVTRSGTVPWAPCWPPTHGGAEMEGTRGPTVFVSYARADVELIREIVENLEKQEHPPFFDAKIQVGQEWWNVILSQIRACPIFLFALSPDSARSRACLAELRYAHDLGKQIVPINIRAYQIEQAPELLQDLNILNFINPDVGRYNELDTILDQIEKNPPPLPTELPAAPPPPIADLTEERRLVEQARVSVEEQHWLVASLRTKVRNYDDRRAAVAVLEQLRNHPGGVDVTVAQAVDDLLDRHRQPPRDAQSTKLLNRVVRALKRESCVPVLGSGMTDWMVGSRRQLAKSWAKDFHYPLHLGGHDDLPQVAQYITVTEGRSDMRESLADFYRTELRERFGPAAARTNATTLDELIVSAWRSEAGGMAAEPHDVLAQMPCKLYITAQPTALLLEALQAQRNKTPEWDYCRWNDRADADDDDDDELEAHVSPFELDPSYEPSVERPLVYQVFGTLKDPDSIVITEDDYFDFLLAIAQHPDLIPTAVRETIAEANLTFLGFGLQDWDVRILLRALVSPEIADELNKKKHVAAEREPGEQDVSGDGARDYLRDYFGREVKPAIDIFWSSTEAFCEGLVSVWHEEVAG
jgi:hypothetical protein